MVNRQELEGLWNEVKGRLKEQWGVVTDDELNRAEGNIEQFVGVIQRRTGRAREDVEQFLDQFVSDSSKTYERVATKAKEYLDDASRVVQDSYGQAADQFAVGYDEARETVRRNPVESVAISFGAGLVTGVLISLLLKSR